MTGVPAETAPGPAETPKEVLKLSKGETVGLAGGKPAQDRIRSLEEEVAARDRTIVEQNERVAKLEKTIKDMQALLELKNKGMADLQKPGAAPVAPPLPGRPEAAQTPPAVPPIAAKKPDTTTPAPMAESVTPAGELPAKPADAAPVPKPKPRPKVVTPPPAPSFTEQILGNPIYLAAIAGILLLVGGVAYMMMRRRRAAGVDEGEAEKKTFDVASVRDETSTGGFAPAAAKPGPDAIAEEVDPLAEAEIYLAYGRDGQAEEILKEALASSPRRAEIQAKLLEIYAKRKDGTAFDAVARDLQVATGGQGELWTKAARLGYQLDPNNPRYLTGKPSADIAAAAAASVGALTSKALDFQIDSLEPQPEIGTLTDIDAGFGRRFATTTAASASNDGLDLNIELDDADTRTKTDIDLSRLGGPGGGTTTDIDLTSLAGADGGTSTDIDLSKIAEGVPQMDFDVSAEPVAKTAAGGSSIDFDFELPGAAASGHATPSTQTVTKAMSQTVADVGEARGGNIEFDLSRISLDPSEPGRTEPKLDLGVAGANMAEFDLSSINLDLAEPQPAPGAGAVTGAKDDRWHDVQTKFDLAKAYQEMGDREGAREILHEVITEGDAEQKAAAEKVLAALA